ncbi:MAG TPA: hypothetical protein VFR87_04385 [Nocardioidaceae bacterium]|nr:hypothetical protein [Nocardioidaceae bacterium]
MAGLDRAIIGLEQALDRPRRHQMWRWLVSHRVASVHDALVLEQGHATDAWLAPRQTSLAREREVLLHKLTRLRAQVADSPNVEPVHGELKRLVSELERHRQKLNDLVYDGVALELGGSE